MKRAKAGAKQLSTLKTKSYSVQLRGEVRFLPENVPVTVVWTRMVSLKQSLSY